MKGLLKALSIVFGCALAASAAAPTLLSSLHAVHALSNVEAAQGPPVEFYATVTYVQPGSGLTFVQEGNEGLQLRKDPNLKLSPGDRVLIRGKAQASFCPIVLADSVTISGHIPVPSPVPAGFDVLNRSELDSRRVTVRGGVRNKDVKLAYGHAVTLLRMQTDGGTIDAWVDGSDPNPTEDMFDDEIEVTGISFGKLDGKSHHIGVKIAVSSFADIKILKRSASSPWALPVTPLDRLLDANHVVDRSARIRVQGTVTFYQPSAALVIQNGDDSLWITTSNEKPLRIGNQVDVTGFGTLNDNHLALTNGEVQQSTVYTPIAPQPVTWRDLPNSKHIFDLVSVEGMVMMEVRKPSQDEYFLAAEGQVFSATYYHHQDDGSAPPPMKEIPLGSMVRVSGICFPLENRVTYTHELPADILMRTPEDITVVAGPSWLNVRNLTMMAGLLFALVVVAAARGWTVERKARRQAAAMAARIVVEASLERRRSHILEDINGSRPLADILEQIVEMVSLTLDQAPCWCEISDGMRVGKCPPNSLTLRVVHEEIKTRTGRVLGTVFLASDRWGKPRPDEMKHLSMAVGLAKVAIETRGLYSDLLHRSEYDLLTDIHNRFSLDKSLAGCILNADLQGSIFGLIYVDLDKFKQVNDVYGHTAGDQYLQQVAVRMKQQLRSVDVLARVGGDEFAVLVPAVHCRAVVEEIARRLERCFDDPFPVGEYVLLGSASVGTAVYPEDAPTKAGLLNAADAAMYKVKNGKRKIGGTLADQQSRHLALKE